MQKLGGNYRENYSPVVDRISVISLLVIASVHEFMSRRNDFVLAFTKSYVYVYVFIDITLGMVFNGNRG